MCSEPVIRAPAQRLRSAYSAPDRHQAGHLMLGELDLLAPEAGQGQVSYLVLMLLKDPGWGAAHGMNSHQIGCVPQP